jgi:Uma2 family endonuclease
MVALKDNTPKFTPEEYFDWEEQQLERHELIDGEVYAMTGGTVNHSQIAVKFISLLDNHLRGSGCKTLNSDCRVNIVGSNNYTYPDLSVTCDKRDKTTTKYITYPCLIIEVLSFSTEAYDRGGKFRMYRQNPILQDYVLVSSEQIEIDLYHKTESGSWEIINYQAGDTIELKSVNLTFAIERIYEGIELVTEVKSDSIEN